MYLRFTKDILVLVLIFLFVLQPPLLAAESSSLQDSESGSAELSDDSNYQKVQSLESTKSMIKRDGNQENSLNDPQMQLIPTIQVHVTGDVSIPGAYHLKLSTRASDVIKKSVPRRDNLRLFQIRNSDQNTKTYDLYKYYYQGDLTQNPYYRMVILFLYQNKKRPFALKELCTVLVFMSWSRRKICYR